MQLSATVRNRSREVAMAVPMVSSAKAVTFGGYQRCVASYRVAGTGLRDIQTCFVFCNVCKSFCVAGAILLHCFLFHRKRSTLETSVALQACRLARF